MSKQEVSRLEVLLRVQSGRLRVGDACVLIGLERRRVFRLLRGLKQGGATSLLSKHRGKPSNHRLPAEVRTLALRPLHHVGDLLARSLFPAFFGESGQSLASGWAHYQNVSHR